MISMLDKQTYNEQLMTKVNAYQSNRKYSQASPILYMPLDF